MEIFSKGNKSIIMMMIEVLYITFNFYKSYVLVKINIKKVSCGTHIYFAVYLRCFNV